METSGLPPGERHPSKQSLANEPQPMEPPRRSPPSTEVQSKSQPMLTTDEPFPKNYYDMDTSSSELAETTEVSQRDIPQPGPTSQVPQVTSSEGNMGIARPISDVSSGLETGEIAPLRPPQGNLSNILQYNKTDTAFERLFPQGVSPALTVPESSHDACGQHEPDADYQSQYTAAEEDRPISGGSMKGLFHPYYFSTKHFQRPGRSPVPSMSDSRPKKQNRVLGEPADAPVVERFQSSKTLDQATLAKRDLYHTMARAGVLPDTAKKVLESTKRESKPVPAENKPKSLEKSILKPVLTERTSSLKARDAKLHTKRRSQSDSQPPSMAPSIPPTPPDRKSTSAANRKVFVVPPPIDPHRRVSAASDYLRTPYPFHEAEQPDIPSLDQHRAHVLQNVQQKSSQRYDLEPALDSLSAYTVLTLSVRRRYSPYGRRVTRLVIPANGDSRNLPTESHSSNTTTTNKTLTTNSNFDFFLPEFNPTRRTSSSKRDIIPPNAYDDALLFRRLRNHYHAELLGSSSVARLWRRHIAARILKRIIVIPEHADAGAPRSSYRQHSSEPNSGPRSPRYLARKGLSDTFSEGGLLRGFRRPRALRRRYGWVSWVHRVARDMDDSLDPQADDDEKVGEDGGVGARRRRMHGGSLGVVPGGLEFVEGWSAGRIVVAFLVVVLLAVAAVLLWVSLGPVPAGAGRFRVSGGGHGLRDAEGRLGTGLAMGVFVVGLGAVAVGGWLWVSWLTM